MAGYDNVIYGTTTLNVTNLRVRRVPGTRKQKIGRLIAKIPVIGLNTKEYEFDIEGVITGTTLTIMETKRDTIEAYDDAMKHNFQTGITSHVGSYMIEPDSLQWTENPNDAQGVYRYRFTLIEYNQ